LIPNTLTYSQEKYLLAKLEDLNLNIFLHKRLKKYPRHE